MKYLRALSFRTKVIIGLALLALFAYSAYSYAWPKYVQWKEDHEVQIVKTKVGKSKLLDLRIAMFFIRQVDLMVHMFYLIICYKEC